MTHAYDPHAEALLDCHRGERDAMLIVYQEDGRDDVPAAFWLRSVFDPVEEDALALCRGRILDLGAGAGVHALALQERGCDVTAIDIAPGCVTVMRERGVRNAQVADAFAVELGRFDTILTICNGLDKVGRLADLPRFLERMRAMLTPDGQLLADSFDLRVGADAAQVARLQARQAGGDYFGELSLCFEYRGKRGAPFRALHVDFDTLAQAAAKAGLRCELLRQDGGHYLVRARPVRAEEGA